MSDSELEDDGTEALVVDSRKMVRREAKPFSSDLKSEEEYVRYKKLLERVYTGATQLNVSCDGYNNRLEGQAGLVRFGNDSEVVLVTSLHNVVKRLRSNPVLIQATFSGPRHKETVTVKVKGVGRLKSSIEQLRILATSQQLSC
jgi:hypothetical protein